MTKINHHLAEHKTESVLISNIRKVETLTIKVGTTEVLSCEAIKYLGKVDRRLHFK